MVSVAPERSACARQRTHGPPLAGHVARSALWGRPPSVGGAKRVTCELLTPNIPPGARGGGALP
jgi:hypothetical protein